MIRAAHDPAATNSPHSRRGRGGMYPPPPCNARKVVAAAISTRAASAQPKAPIPVNTRSFEIGDSYHGRNMLPTNTAHPITAILSFAPSPRRSRPSPRSIEAGSSVQRLAATVSGLELVPVVDVVLAQLPAEVDLTAVDQRGE